jgi:hypothetical protein
MFGTISLIAYGRNATLKITASAEEINDTFEYFLIDRVINTNLFEIERDVKNLYGKKIQIINSTENKAHYYGNRIHINYSTPNLPVVMAHEIEHTYFTIREYKANHNAIIRLWESDIDYLRYSASKLARQVLLGGYKGNYDCTQLLVNYYKERTYEANS